ncbi:cyclopropane-fatty-acyl-phospholipid synthase family protein [Brevundimonas sp.]|uniref:SAM-dependent methyltransferase n=1 Tax=Brevundimonas sp. TaxID=1871086 RepID=UPI0035678C1A
MSMSFQRIAYEALEVCNGVTMAAVEAAVAAAGLPSGTLALDIGTGNAGVAIRLAEAFGFEVTAVELDPVMADLARARIAAAGRDEQVKLVVGSAAEVLARTPPVELISALGTTNITGGGRPTPQESFVVLRRNLKPGGWLLWGDLVWLSEPPGPLRQLVEATNLYADDAGWRAAAERAGFEVVETRLSSQEVFNAYARDSVGAVRHWLTDNPDAPEAPHVAFNADRVQAFFDFGRGVMGFGLYLMRNPD